MGKHKIRTLVLLALILSSILYFRESLLVHFFPKIILSRAINHTFRQLEERYTDSPILFLLRPLNGTGVLNAQLNLDTEIPGIGASRYEMDLSYQFNPHRVAAKGTLASGYGMMDWMLYLDRNIGAAASETLTGGSWYGISYNSFQKDLRSFPFLEPLIGEGGINELVTRVTSFESKMDRNYSLLKISPDMIKAVLLACLALKPKIEEEESRNSYSITFRIQGTELAEKASPYIPQAPQILRNLIQTLEENPNSQFTVIFHLQNRRLTTVETSLRISEASYVLLAALDGDILQAELILRDSQCLDSRELILQTFSDESPYRERLVYHHRINGTESEFSADYTWDLSSGDLLLNIHNKGFTHPIRLNLRGEGESISITCRDLSQLWSLLSGKEVNLPAICTLTLSPGNPIAEQTEFKNLADWSWEDLFLILNRIFRP